jgi:hypothetical protein
MMPAGRREDLPPQMPTVSFFLDLPWLFFLMVNETLYRCDIAWPVRKTRAFFGWRLRLLNTAGYVGEVVFSLTGIRGVGAMLSLHQHGREEDVLPHNGGDIAFPGRRPGLTVQLTQDKEDGDREQ